MHFCIIGCGGIAKKHAEVLKKLENSVPGKPARLSFASRSLDKAEYYKKKFKGDFTFAKYEEAFHHKDIDAVILCTPNDQHREQALAALAGGKHVIIEKPITISTEEADEILAKAKEVDREVLVAENHRYRPAIRYLNRLVRSGDLGTPKIIRMTVMRKFDFSPDDWRSQPNQMGGGPLIDGGIHWINALLTLGGGGATEIKALEPPTTIANCPREDSIIITCKLTNGAIGVLTYSWGIKGSFPLGFISVHGDKGSIYVGNTGMFGLKSISFPRPILLSFRDWKGYEAMWHDFLVTLGNNSGDKALATGAMGRRDLAFVEAAYASASGKSAAINSPKKTKVA